MAKSAKKEEGGVLAKSPRSKTPQGAVVKKADAAPAKQQLIRKEREEVTPLTAPKFCFASAIVVGAYILFASGYIVIANKRTDFVAPGRKNLELFPMIGAGIVIMSTGIADLLEIKLGDGPMIGFPLVATVVGVMFLWYMDRKQDLSLILQDTYFVWNHAVMFYGTAILLVHSFVVMCTHRYRSTVWTMLRNRNMQKEQEQKVEKKTKKDN